MIVFDDVLSQVVKTAERFSTDFASEDAVYLIEILLRSTSHAAAAAATVNRRRSSWAFRAFPGVVAIITNADLLVRRHHFGVMLRLLHVDGQGVQAAEALSAIHAFQNVLRLFLASAQPNVLTADQFPRHGQLLS